MRAKISGGAPNPLADPAALSWQTQIARAGLAWNQLRATHSMNDEENESLLVALVQHGDAAAFETLLRRLYRPLRGYIAAMVGDSAAEDVLQEVSLRIYRHIRFLREPKAFRAWAYRIATRIAFVHLEREKQWRRAESEPDFQHAFPSVVLPLDESDSEFLSMVDRVSPASRAVLLLHYQQHLSLEEAAAILDIPVGTAKSRLSYGLATLRRFIKEQEKQ
jgi:RNA polymerase sigma-70 factor (ECF subfamily)